MKKRDGKWENFFVFQEKCLSLRVLLFAIRLKVPVGHNIWFYYKRIIGHVVYPMANEKEVLRSELKQR